MCWTGAFAAAVEQYALDTAGEPAPVFNFVRYDAPRRELEGGEATSVYIRFSSYAASEFRYDAEAGRYYKWEFGEPQMDEAAGVQYAADNLLLLFASIGKYSTFFFAVSVCFSFILHTFPFLSIFLFTKDASF